MRSPYVRNGLAAALAILFSFPLAAAPPQNASALFADLCSSCHTIGGGDLAGPDLAAASKLPPSDLRAAIDRMEANARALTPEEKEALIALLRRADAKDIVANAAQPLAPPSVLAHASPEAGRHLFFGQRALANGGAPCFACHTVSGRGGNLARDLTQVHLRMPENAVVSAMQQPPFPMMKASYVKHPVTEQEAAHISAFLKQAGAAPLAQGDGRIVPQIAATLASVFLGVLALYFGRRHDSVRARLLRDSRGR